MKISTAFLCLCAAPFLAPRAFAGLLSAGSVAVLDANSAPRATFNNTERITFQQRVFNGAASVNRVTFTFIVLSPAGAPVFQINGNSVPGSVGNAATQLSGFPIAKFYAGPGVYTLQAQASLDAQTITQQTTFVISSPNLFLLYPPNGAQNIADVPLTFRWNSSGGSTYRVTVGDNPSFFNALFKQQTTGPETVLSYPTNPSDPRMILSAGQIYYWKVEALDANGQVLATSAFPYSFTVQSAALSRDIAVTGVAISGAPDPAGNIPFDVTIVNQGGTAQAGVPLRFSVGGLPAAGSPVTISMLSPSETRDFTFSAPLPPGQSQSVAIACVDFSDDNIVNNCKTMVLNQASAAGGTTNFGGNTSPEQIWKAIQDLLAQQGLDLSDYNLVGMEGQLTPDELKNLLASIRSGQAGVSLSGPTVTAPTVALSTAPAAAPTRTAPAQSSPSGVAPEIEESVPVGTEWAGLSAPLTPQARGVLISDEKVWRKLWRQVQVGRVPKVNFDEFMVACVFAGKGEKRDHADFDSIEMSLSGLVIRYKLVNYATFNVSTNTRATVPYHLRVIPRTNVPVRFERVEETEDVPSKPKPQGKKTW
jgi:hypothetical protein